MEVACKNCSHKETYKYYKYNSWINIKSTTGNDPMYFKDNYYWLFTCSECKKEQCLYVN